MPDEITLLLKRACRGDVDAESRLCELVNDELRLAAAALVRRKGPFAEPSSLVNEAFLRLFRREGPLDLKCKSYFFAAAVDQMAKILAERIRRRSRMAQRVPLSDVEAGCDLILNRFHEASPYDFEALERALARSCRSRVAAKRRRHRLVKNRILGGLSLEEAAELAGISLTQARRDERLALAELHAELMEFKR
jgi:DNA-directed RNA polymerase specialized sigma24 family protein